MNVQHPANSHYLSMVVGSVINFDILDPEWTTKYFFNFDYDIALGDEQIGLGKKTILNQQMQINEYETFNPMLNVGGIILIAVYYFIILAFYLLLKFVIYIITKSQKN